MPMHMKIDPALRNISQRFRAAPAWHVRRAEARGEAQALGGPLRDIPYDTVKDFAPVTLVGNSPLVLVVHPTLPVKRTKELIALAKSRKRELTYASSGSGGPLHIAAELFICAPAST
jgi:tripartite-type tricarboxylate transporter receptor subunit TctC